MPATFYSDPFQSFSLGDFTVATLPSASLYPKRLAWVTDLHDGQPDYVMSDGTYWKDTRPEAVRIVTNANSDQTIQPLINSPIQIAQGTLSINRNWTIATTRAYPGQTITVKREAGGALVSLLVNGIGIGLNSWADFVFNGTAFVQARSGGLL